MSRRPPALLLAALPIALAAPLAGCDHGGRSGVPPDPPPRTSPSAHLAHDTPAPPAAPTLDVRGEPGALRFAWDAPPTGTRTVRLIEHDRRDGVETTIATVDPALRGHRLAVAPHRLAWDALSWRLERCGEDGCASSPHVIGSAHAAATFDVVAPGVAVADERFGERLALNASGSLLAVARPVAGRLELHYLRDDGVVAGDTLPVLDAPPSTTRALDVALSASGDTVAVLSGDAALGRDARVLVLERLGEGWLESARFAAFPDADPPIGTDAARPHVVLSDDGTRLLAACTGAPDCRAVVHGIDVVGWRAVATLDAPGESAAPLALAASGTLGRVAIVSAGNAPGSGGGSPTLRVHDVDRDWRESGPVELSDFAADAPIGIALDDGGGRIAIGGLEPSREARPAAVLWHHRLELADGLLALDAEASLRMPGPASGDPGTISLAVDAALETLAFGWVTAHDAALVTRVRRGDAWLSALNLPDAAAHLAKRRFGADPVLARDGATLALDDPGDPADPPGELRVGQVLVMRAHDAATTLRPFATLPTFTPPP